jgi:hypothetical protein
MLAFMLISGATLRADSFTASMQTGPQTPAPILPGGSATYAITISKTNSGALEMDLSALGLPPGVTASFSPASLRFTSNLLATATLTLSTTSGVTPGLSPFSVIARAGGSQNILTNNATLDVVSVGPFIVQLPDGHWRFTVVTPPGKNYLVQASTNCFAPCWTTISTNSCGTNNLLIFIDADVCRYPSRFYRAVEQ